MGFGRGGNQGGYQGGGRGGNQTGYQGGGRAGNSGGYQGGGRGGNQDGYQGGGRGRGRGRGGGQQNQSHNGLAGLAFKEWDKSTQVVPGQQPTNLLSWITKQTGGARVVQHQLVGHRQNVLLVWVEESWKHKVLGLNNRGWGGINVVVETSTKAPPDSSSSGGGFGQPNNQQNQQNHQNNNHFGSQNNLMPVAVQEQLVASLRQAYVESDKHLLLTGVVSHAAFDAIPGIETADPEQVWDEIFNLCKTQIWPNNHQRNINVPSITLRQNNIRTFREVRSLARVFPRLRNLDLGGNMLQNVDGLQDLLKDFHQLEHLILDTNPISVIPDLSTTIKQWCPKLKNLTLVPAGSSVLVAQPGLAPLGTGIGQTPFRADTQQASVQEPFIDVAPQRPFHPEIPKDSLFAVPTMDKPAALLAAEEKGLQVSLATGLNMATTEELLKANQWDIEKALEHFAKLQSTGQIGQDRFLPRS